MPSLPRIFSPLGFGLFRIGPPRRAGQYLYSMPLIAFRYLSEDGLLKEAQVSFSCHGVTRRTPSAPRVMLRMLWSTKT